MRVFIKKSTIKMRTEWVVIFPNGETGVYLSVGVAAEEIWEKYGRSQVYPTIAIDSETKIVGVKPIDGYAYTDWVLVDVPDQQALRELQVALSKKYEAESAEIRAKRSKHK